MKETKQLKVSMEDVQGALSQVKQVYHHLQNGGIGLPPIENNGMCEQDKLFSYLNAIYESICKNGIQVESGQYTNVPKSDPSSQPFAEYNGLIGEIKTATVQACLEAMNTFLLQKEADRLCSDAMDARLYVEHNEAGTIGSEEDLKKQNSVYTQIIHHYEEMIRIGNDQEKSLAERDSCLINSLDCLNKTVEPLIPIATDAIKRSKTTVWSIVKENLIRWKCLPRWRNPYTYLFIVLSCCFIVLWVLTWVRFNDVRDERDLLWRENQVHRVVDLYMSDSSSYCKERDKIQEMINNKGLPYTWYYIKEIRARHDTTEVRFPLFK